MGEERRTVGRKIDVGEAKNDRRLLLPERRDSFGRSNATVLAKERGRIRYLKNQQPQGDAVKKKEAPIRKTEAKKEVVERRCV